jgi:hypothetical protein
MVGGAAREVGGARADRGRGGRVVAERNADDGGFCRIPTDAVNNAGSIARTASPIGGSWLGTDSAVGGTCTGETQAFGTSVTASAWKGMTLGAEAADREAVGTKGERNASGMTTGTAGANDGGVGADGGREGGMTPVDVAFIRSFLVGGAPSGVVNIALATASMRRM